MQKLYQKYIQKKSEWAVCALAMAVVVLASNFLVTIPINDWLTWGAFTYPLAFLVCDVANRLYGARRARQVVLVGFVIGVALSFGVDMRIAIASGSAYLIAQLLDIQIFHKLRHQNWYIAPVVSSFIASGADTVIFFTLAFYDTGLPWVTWGIGDFAAKLTVLAFALVPYRHITLALSARQAGP